MRYMILFGWFAALTVYVFYSNARFQRQLQQYREVIIQQEAVVGDIMTVWKYRGPAYGRRDLRARTTSEYQRRRARLPSITDTVRTDKARAALEGTGGP